MSLTKPPRRPRRPSRRADAAALGEFLDHVHLGPRQSHKALGLWPLLRTPDAPPPRGPAYVLLSSALEDGFVSVEEVSRGGSVPHVRVSNRGTEAVLALFGEELVGAKQNRVVNASFLIPAKGDVVIDVSCVEQGRWERRDGGDEVPFFTESAPLVSGSLRRHLARDVACSLASDESFRGDQGKVWDLVDERLQTSGTDSATWAYADYARGRARDVAELRKPFRPLEGQVGFVAAFGDLMVGFEAIGRPEVFANLFPRLLHSYAIDAVDATALYDLDAPWPYDAPEPFLAALAAAAVTPGPSLGLGSDLRFRGESLEGCALAAGDLVHATAFPDFL